MSDKPAAAAAAAAAKPAADKKPAADEKKGKDAGGKKKGAGLLAKTPVLVGAVMALEAVVLFAGFKTLGGGPRPATADLMLGHEGTDAKGDGGKADGKPAGAAKATVELPVCELRAPNKQSGRTFLYDVSIFAVVPADQQDKTKELFSGRDALIKDRVRTIIAELDPDKLSGGSEPGLETLRRQVKFQLDQIVGEGVVDEVLVPRCLPFRTDY